MINRTFIEAGIKNLLKRNYRINPNVVDVHALVDETLGFNENWRIIKELLNIHAIKATCPHCGEVIE